MREARDVCAWTDTNVRARNPFDQVEPSPTYSDRVYPSDGAFTTMRGFRQ